MYLHFTENDKKLKTELESKYNEILESLKATARDFQSVQYRLKDNFAKLFKKGRVNVPLDTTLFDFTYTDTDGKALIEIRSVKYEGKDYLQTLMIDESAEYGAGMTKTLDLTVNAQVSNILLRVLYKVSEIILKGVLRYEKDKESLREALELKKEIGLGVNLNAVEVTDILMAAETRLDNLHLISHQRQLELNDFHENKPYLIQDENGQLVNTETNKVVNMRDFTSQLATRVTDIDSDLSLLSQFKKYRSEKEIIVIESEFEGKKLLDTLKIRRDENSGKYHYELTITKLDKLRDNSYDIVPVTTSLELRQETHSKVLTDYLNVLLTTVENRLEML